MIKLLSFLFLFGCGLKITRKVDDNILLGTWKMYRITCFTDVNSTKEIETYEIGDISTIKLEFNGNRLNYTSSGTCSTSSNGLYETDFNGTSTGKLNFVNILTGGTTCSEIVVDLGENNVGNATIPTTLLDINSSNLQWLITTDKTILELDYFTTFSGTAEDAGCKGSCVCKSYLQKQ